ncbi:MAG TPA: RNA polymerase sigma factor SigJ, partial [Acidimicrobiales bacterium]|nr:RNA polymerase sigma factor SigJ [Acidimicrobiales bacterium]
RPPGRERRPVPDAAPVGAVERALVAERPRLVGLAYRITGSRVDAEDIVQEAWERAGRVDEATIDSPSAWLTTVVSRLALDHLRAAKRRRETYVGPWLPEPIVTAGRSAGWAAGAGAGAVGRDPSELVEMAESLTFGFLRVLEALSPVERVVFVMADVFGVPFPEIAAAVDRSPDACRQVASRARRRVRDEHRRSAPVDDARAVVDDLLAAFVAGDTARVLDLLAPDVVLVSDGGAEVHAARRPVVGPDRVARLVANLLKRGVDLGYTFEPTELNGAVGVLARIDDEPGYVAALTVVDGRVRRIYTVSNPDKLAALRLTGPVA